MYYRYEDESKYKIARHVLSDLDTMGEEGHLIQRRIITDLCKLKKVPDDSVTDKSAGIEALRWLKKLAVEQKLLVKKERSESKGRAWKTRQKQVVLATRAQKMEQLRSDFTAMTMAKSQEEVQRRGYDLEELLAQHGISPVTYKPCYVDTETRWHDGDVFMWRLQGNQVIDVVSPVEGYILYSTLQIYGANIIIETPYLYEGKRVYMQLRHFDSLDDAAKQGLYVYKGQHIGTLKAGGEVDPGGNNILDFKLYRGDDWHYDNTTPEGQAMVFDTAPFHLDDLELIPHKEVPRCEGNPK